MTLMDVFTMLKTQGYIKKLNRVKDIQTSIRYLTRALGKEHPEQCQQDDFLLAESVWQEKLETYFESLDKKPGAITRRNTRNNLRFLFRTAHDAGLITPPQSLPLLPSTRRQHMKLFAQTSPYRNHWLAAHRISYKLPQHAWPPDIQAVWQTYAVSQQLKVRQSTLDKYSHHLSYYLGFLVNIEGLSVQWDDLFDTSYLDRFIRWHSQKQQVGISVTARETAATLKILALHLNHPSLSTLKDYTRGFPTPEPIHDKRHHEITLRELENVGLSALHDARKPLNPHNHGNMRPGLTRALQHQHALMLRLLVRATLRSRNLREIQLDKNLYQDRHDHWHLSLRGSELKIGTRNRRTNEYHVNLTEYCPDLLPHLEEFLKVYRPRIPQTDTSPLLFRTHHGNPYTGAVFHKEISSLVLRRTNKRFYPHLIRTIWASEYLSTKGATVEVAAAMLGDTPQMVYKRYYETQEKKAHARASEFLTGALKR